MLLFNRASYWSPEVKIQIVCRQSDGAIPFDNEVLCTVIMSCIVLHNYCRARNMDFPIAADIAEAIREEREAQQAAGPCSSSDQDSLLMGYKVRKMITDSYFK